MKKLNKELAQKSFKEVYVPKANTKALIKAELVHVVTKALNDYGIATMTGKDINNSKSPFEIFFMLGDEQVKIKFTNPKDNQFGYRKYDYIDKDELRELEKRQDMID